MLEKFVEVVQKRHEYAKDYRAKTGKDVYGFFCCYSPEEIVYAAGILPVRVYGEHEPQDLSAPHMSGMYCPFCRNTLAEGLKGSYDYLHGIFMGQSCTHIRHSFDSWRWHVLTTRWSYFTGMPATVKHRGAKKLLTTEYGEMKKSLEAHLGRRITDDALNKAFDVYNTNRGLLRRLYELRKQDPPPISGVETHYVVQASMLMDKAEHNELLKQLLAWLPTRKDRPTPGVRLLMVGGEDDDPNVLQVIEDAGASIVADDVCFGTRYFWNDIVKESEPLAALAQRYLDKPGCPTKDIAHRERHSRLLSTYKDYNCRGVFFFQQKFCDPHEFDIPPLKKLCDANSIPSFFFELDATLPKAELRSRAEAFLETLEPEVATLLSLK